MEKRIKDLTEEEFILLVEKIVRKTMEDISEDFLALSSKNYLESIQEARKDYKEGRIKSLEDVFNV